MVTMEERLRSALDRMHARCAELELDHPDYNHYGDVIGTLAHVSAQREEHQIKNDAACLDALDMAKACYYVLPEITELGVTDPEEWYWTLMAAYFRLHEERGRCTAWYTEEPCGDDECIYRCYEEDED